MWKSILFYLTFLAITSATLSFAQDQAVDWGQASAEVSAYLKSDHDSLKILAMQRIIVNPDKFKLNSEVYTIYDIYRNHKKDPMRQLALVCLYRMKYSWILKNLANDVYTEKNPTIRKQIIAILRDQPILTALR